MSKYLLVWKRNLATCYILTCEWCFQAPGDVFKNLLNQHPKAFRKSRPTTAFLLHRHQLIAPMVVRKAFSQRPLQAVVATEKNTSTSALFVVWMSENTPPVNLLNHGPIIYISSNPFQFMLGAFWNHCITWFNFLLLGVSIWVRDLFIHSKYKRMIRGEER